MGKMSYVHYVALEATVITLLYCLHAKYVSSEFLHMQKQQLVFTQPLSWWIFPAKFFATNRVTKTASCKHETRQNFNWAMAYIPLSIAVVKEGKHWKVFSLQQKGTLSTILERRERFEFNQYLPIYFDYSLLHDQRWSWHPLDLK